MLFTPLTLRGLTLPNRIAMSPMCQYSAVDGLPGAWHTAHYGARAQGGVGLVLLESTAVSPEGRITPGCLGLWNDEQQQAHADLVRHLHELGAAAGLQLNHAGRKGSVSAPWQGGKALAPDAGAWQPVAPSLGAHADGFAEPRELRADELPGIVEDFVRSARRAVAAGYDVVEVHAAHGYLLHQFLSPLSNARTDDYGGNFDNRIRLLLEVVTAVRAAIPDAMPLFVRLSCVDSQQSGEGWTVDESIALAQRLSRLGVDLVDCTSGGLAPPDAGPRPAAFNAHLAFAVRSLAEVPTGSVGGIADRACATLLLEQRSCDLVILGRALLRDPYWPMRASLHTDSARIPAPYLRGDFKKETP
jgi:2,4-dienoyl-CoA reductase-like NADH-dependent reductase (Old Yellow Enzyme family)